MLAQSAAALQILLSPAKFAQRATFPSLEDAAGRLVLDLRLARVPVVDHIVVAKPLTRLTVEPA